MIDSDFVGTVGTVGAQNVYPEKKDTFSDNTAPEYYLSGSGRTAMKIVGMKVYQVYCWPAAAGEDQSEYSYRVWVIKEQEFKKDMISRLHPTDEAGFKATLRNLVDFIERIRTKI